MVVQDLKMAWSKRFIPKLFVWHSLRDIVRMKWRYYQTGLYTEKKRSHWLKQWPIRKGLGDKKGELSLVEDVIWTSSKRWTGQPNGEFPALARPPIPDSFTNPPSVNIFLTTPNVPYITIRTNSLSSLESALHFISPPWKRLSSNLWILFSANKKNSFTPRRSPKRLKLFIGWLLQRFDEVQITSSSNDNSPFLIS